MALLGLRLDVDEFIISARFYQASLPSAAIITVPGMPSRRGFREFHHPARPQIPVEAS
jgi:hypothetical protein